jgi:hypothetical protein
VNYHYAIEQCDVQDRSLLKNFREKRSAWLLWLDHKEPSSIDNQFYSMMWCDAVFWTLNEARKFAAENSPSSAITPILAEFIDHGYLAQQILSISKLVEKNSPQPGKGIISLRRLVDEICENSFLFTRENYVCNDGLPFDPELARQKFLQRMATQTPSFSWMPTDGPEAWDTSVRVHQEFDELSGSPSDNRSRKDCISDRVFTSLRAAFDDTSFDHILAFRHKIFAHAADPQSRSYAKTQIDRVELENIIRAQKILCQLMQTISSYILCGPSFTSVVAIPQFNQFAHITLPYVSPDHRTKLSTFWSQHCRERNEWLKRDLNQVLSKS